MDPSRQSANFVFRLRLRKGWSIKALKGYFMVTMGFGSDILTHFHYNQQLVDGLVLLLETRRKSETEQVQSIMDHDRSTLWLVRTSSVSLLLIFTKDEMVVGLSLWRIGGLLVTDRVPHAQRSSDKHISSSGRLPSGGHEKAVCTGEGWTR